MASSFPYLQVDYKIGVKGLLAKSKEDIDKCCKGEYFMQLKYVDTKEEIIAINRKSKHIEPHLHNALEIVCVTSGALELGVGQELYHMEKGDIGLSLIHIFNIDILIVVFTEKGNSIIHLMIKVFIF